MTALPDTSGYYKQLFRHEPSEGLIGDCWRTCIANLMGLKPQAVPHFLELHMGAGTPDDVEVVRAKTQAWLADRNLQLVGFGVTISDTDTTSRFGAVPYILGGQSGRSDISHVVIGYGPFQTLFDPSQEPRPLLPFESEDGQQYYWIDFLVPINLGLSLKNF